MLTSDLVRLEVRDAVVTPRWLKPSAARDLERAERLIKLFEAHVGETRGELDEALKIEAGQGNDFRIRRGLAKLLLDRTTVETPGSLSPPEVRAAAFELAAGRHPLDVAARAEVLAAVAERLGATPEAAERSLYADLASHQRIVAFDTLAPEALVERYNVALAQAVLLRSRGLAVTLASPEPKRLRQLLSALKFHRLMYQGTREGDRYTIRIDGPLSILKSSTRYGVGLANFLPALLLAERWTLEADYQAKKGAHRATFRLDPSAGLVSPARDLGMWAADEERAFRARLDEVAAPWTVSDGGELIDLDGKDAFVPDLVLTDPGSGKRALVEIVWRWRKAALQKRLSLLQQVGPPNLVLAISSADEAVPALPGAVLAFKSLPNAKKLVELARQVAR